MTDENQTPESPEDYQVVDLNTHDVAGRISPWLDAAFERYGQGERFVFQITVHVNPPLAPNMPPSFQPAVIVWLPGAMLNTVMSGAFQISNPCAITREEIEATVQGLVEGLLQARSQDLIQATNGAGGDAPPLRLT